MVSQRYGFASLSSLLLVALVATLLLLLGSCKKSGGSSQNQSAGKAFPAISAGKMEELPACTAGNVNQMAYVADESSFVVCKDNKWMTATVRVAGSTTETIELPPDEQCPYGAKKIRVGYVPAGETKPAQDATEIVVCNGAPGTDSLGPVFSEAMQLYKKYRRSIYRLAVQCTSGMAWTASAFRCSETQVCTNFHAVDKSQCGFGSFSRLTLEAVKDENDTTATIFFTTNSPQIKAHTTKDVAKVVGGNFPANSIVVPIMAKDATKLDTLSPILSLSFPLGFEELYTDVGNVNVNAIKTCPTPTSCPGAYDFGTNNNTDHGSSGSPLMEIRSGKVVGVTTAGTDNVNANFTWALYGWHFNEI